MKLLKKIMRKILDLFFTIKIRFLYKPNNDLTIISQNCIGGLIYHRLGMQFKTPTINLVIKGKDFIKLCKNPEYYFQFNAKETNLFGEANNYKYPIIQVADVMIHCFHYSSHSEAVKKWNERRKRINFKNICLIGNTWDLFNNKSLIKEFLMIDRPKILFTDSRDLKNKECINYVDKVERDEKGVPTLLPTEFIKFRYKRVFEKNKFGIYKFLKKLH